MHPEHEEAMRTDFADRVATAWAATWPGVTDAEACEIACSVAEYDQRWSSGPHAQHWAFLHACYLDWQRHPAQMRLLTADVDVHRAIYDNAGLTDIHRRSLRQAGHLTDEERAISRGTPVQPHHIPLHRER